MKETYTNDSHSQKEALINEFKGNLFEYLVGSQMASALGLESRFIQSFGGELRVRLSEYESWLRQNDPELVGQLPNLALETSRKILSYFPTSGIQNVLVMGKVGAGGGNERFKEADLLLLYEGEKVIPVSLKLCKANSFVNTKSAGVKSFIKKYFGTFEESFEKQEELDQIVQMSFLDMANQMYELVGLRFAGGFDGQWVDSGHPELPGQLEPGMNQVVVKSYRPVIAKVREILLEFFGKNEKLFLHCLKPLCGFGQDNMTQVTCFHSSSKEGRYQTHSIHISDEKSSVLNADDVHFPEENREISSFEISLGKLILQIRIKPMNKFTVPAHKINCSVKKR